MEDNFLLMTDSYKLGHWKMMPEGTEKVYSYFEAREGAEFGFVEFIGLQPLLMKYLEGRVVTPEKIREAKAVAEAHIGPGCFNSEMWEYIDKRYDGRLPVKIKAVPEGTCVPVNNVLMTVENTDPKCYALTNYLETLLSQVWYPSTVATKSKAIKNMLSDFLQETSINPEAVNFMLHDFGYRGVSSQESAGMGGLAHLVNFMGTDTIMAMQYAMKYYDAPLVPAYSVYATEHSVMTALGREGEMEVFAKLLKDFPTGILSVVIDSYDYRNFLEVAGTRFKDEILARDGKVVFRPDSGIPDKVTMECLESLEKNFGTITNNEGFKVLNPKVGVLWGDGIDMNGVAKILMAMHLDEWSAENIVFGMGGALLQKVNRDTQRFAFKSSYQERNGVGYSIQKDPLDKSKRSKKGRLMLTHYGDAWETKEEVNVSCGEFEGQLEAMMYEDVLETVFLNGKIIRKYSFDEVRANAK